jgi:transposase
MFVHTINTKAKSGKVSHKCNLLRRTYRKDGKVKTETLCNLNHCSDEQIEALKIALKNPKHILESSFEPFQLTQGESIGAIWTIYSAAKYLGIESVLGTDLQGKLAMFQVISRVLSQGSRLSATRNQSPFIICDILGITKNFNEDHLYRNLSWVETNKDSIEKKLIKVRQKEKKTDELFLYDVTSSYLEGDKNFFGNYGYNRDGKKGKKQIVIGLLCDSEGVPISIELFEGNTNDLKTFQNSIDKVKNRYKCERITLVGDRGMIKSEQIKNLKKENFHYITAITKNQINTLVSKNLIHPEMFDNELVEVEHDGNRYIMRRNPIRAMEIIKSRHEKIKKIRKLKREKIDYLLEHPKAKISVALKAINAKIKKLKIENFIEAIQTCSKISLKINLSELKKMRVLDGCYVLKSNLPPAVPIDVIHSRYKDLGLVEQAFRTSKTTFLEIRPWYVRTKGSSIGHAVIVMLSYQIVQYLKKAWRGINLTVKEGLNSLSSLCAMKVKMKNGVELNQIPEPNEQNAKLLKSIDVILPTVLPSTGARVSSRKELHEKRKAA